MLNKFNATVAVVAVLYLNIATAVTPVAVQTPAATTDVSLPAEIKTMLRESNLSEDAIGVMVMRVTDGKVVVSHGAATAMQPASTMKVLTAIVGLDSLGPAYRSRTELTTTGKIDNNVLTGDVVLRGLGNTDIVWEDFERMLLTLRHKIFKPFAAICWWTVILPTTRLDIGVTPFDESIEFRYNVIPDALMLNMNLAEYAIETNNERFSHSANAAA
ncbi:MAG: hypothetical protein HC782_04335 [Gammaproteobacteria bacterium]|nr:hypothetical protein [Gammaproteobacteria bacterium]